MFWTIVLAMLIIIPAIWVASVIIQMSILALTYLIGFTILGIGRLIKLLKGAK